MPILWEAVIKITNSITNIPKKETFNKLEEGRDYTMPRKKKPGRPPKKRKKRSDAGKPRRKKSFLEKLLG